MQLNRDRYKDAAGAIVLLLVLQAVLALQTGAYEGILTGPDVHMWLVRVMQLHEGGPWFDHAIHRVDPPIGYEQHWTRPFDVLLYAGAWLGSFLTEFRTALHVWSIAISPVIGILAVLAMFWAMAPLPGTGDADSLGILFITQMSVIAVFIAGRADHQSLIILFFIVSLGVGIRLLSAPFSRSLCYWGAGACALAVWVSLESLLYSLLIFLALGLFWLRGEIGFSKKLFHFSAALFILLLAFRLIEFGFARLPEPAFDQISIVHVTLIGLLSIFSAAIYAFDRTGQFQNGSMPRLGVAIGGAATIAATMAWIFPDVLSNPMRNSDELFATLFLANIAELQPVVSLSAMTSGDWWNQLAKFFLWLGIVIPGIPLLAHLARQDSGSDRINPWIYIVICSCIYLPLSFLEIRWTPYVAILFLPGYAWLVSGLMKRVSRLAVSPAGGLLKIATLIFCAFVFAIPSSLVDAEEADKTYADCSLPAVSRYVNDPEFLGGGPRHLLTYTVFGPELLYRTKHTVLSIPSHRYQPGFADGYEIFSSVDPDQALRLIRAKQIDLILVCDGGLEASFYENELAVSFHHRLLNRQAPAWAEEVPLPDYIEQSFRLYRVLQPSNSGRSTRADRRELRENVF